MALQFPDFKRISFNEANPAMVGTERGQALMQHFLTLPQDLQHKILANQISQAKAKYAEPMAQQGLQEAILKNQYYGPLSQSTMGLQGAEAAKTRFMTENPQYISPEAALLTQAIGKHPTQGAGGGGGYTSSNQDYKANTGNDVSGGATEFGDNNRASPEEVRQKANQLDNSGQQQPAPDKTAGYNMAQYHPDAMAFNPPTLQSPTGNPAADNMYYKKFGMSPIQQTQLELSKAQAEKYQTENVERNKDFNNQAVLSNQSSLDAQKFLDASQKAQALERGPLAGRVPGLKDAAQNMDAYGNNMVTSAAQLFQGGKAIHAADIELQKIAKPSRLQNKDVAEDLAHGIIAKNDRNKEKQLFYSRATQLGLKPEIMDSMWNKYETDRPYMDPETHMPNDSYKGTWQDYLHPEVVNSFLQGKEYYIPDQKKLEQDNWTAKDLKDMKDWARKNGKDPAAINKNTLYTLAKNEKTTLANVKREFIKNGILK